MAGEPTTATRQGVAWRWTGRSTRSTPGAPRRIRSRAAGWPAPSPLSASSAQWSPAPINACKPIAPGAAARSALSSYGRS